MWTFFVGRGAVALRPYGDAENIHDADDAVDVVWHYDEFVIVVNRDAMRHSDEPRQ